MPYRILAGTTLAVLILAGSAQTEEPLKSGPQVGAKNNRRGFYPEFVSGPYTGQRRCPV
jgi:hypothetical protein